MPFQSEKQKRYLWANEPKIAREWTDRYGAANGGIMRVGFANPHAGGYTSSKSSNKGSDRGHSRFEPGSGYYGETKTTSPKSGGGNNREKYISKVTSTYTPKTKTITQVNPHTGKITNSQIKQSLINKNLRNRNNPPSTGGANNLIKGIIGTALGLKLDIPGLGLITSGKYKDVINNINDWQGDWREKHTGYRTQEEYEDARDKRRDQNRLDDLIDRKNKGKGYSEKNLQALLEAGVVPSTNQNVDSGRGSGLRDVFQVDEQVDEGIAGIDSGYNLDEMLMDQPQGPYNSGYNMDDAILQSNYEDIRGSGGDDITFAEYMENINRSQPNSGIGTVSNDFPLKGTIEGWNEYKQPEEWQTQDFPVRKDFYPGDKTKWSSYETGKGLDWGEFIDNMRW